ncbi:hypothetical protein HQ865_13970 [Mucilaginibacter mali]|uniref:Uncharacterized protein n=1 Tax=Mucilaginibacter mali TaxID=2740462 RepID=A0A7D4Q4A7_9SPHI|nr:hypothetical protein [Mucilaginibacter mali]QKJ30807.1 hypothetical protein HQ865_13970 [Mucilaginibacter mali]
MKFTTPYITLNEPIPAETLIYYSKQNAIYRSIIPAIILICAIPGLFYEKELSGLIPLSLFCLGAIILMGYNLKVFLTFAPQIIINEAGIRVANLPFVDWQHVSEAKVVGKLGRGWDFYFVYRSSVGKKKIRVKDLNIGSTELMVLLDAYKKGTTY